MARKAKRPLHHHLKKHLKRLAKHAKDHFIPHKGNHHHPKILRHQVLVGYSIFLILLKTAAVILPIALPSSSLYSSAISRANIIDLTNQTRKSLDLPILVQNPLLDQAAQAKAEDMLAKQYFAHTSPEGKTAVDFINQVGYAYHFAAENLAVHYASAEDVNSGWLASANHRTNIVSPKYQDIGIGIVNGTFENEPSVFVVQLFGQPWTNVSPENSVATNTTTTVPLAFTTSTKSNSNTSTLQVASATKVPPLDERSIKLIPQNKTMQIAIAAPEAKHVQVELGYKTTELKPSPTVSSTWEGTLDLDKASMLKQGEALTALIQDQHGHTTSTALGFIAPEAEPKDIYGFKAPDRPALKFFQWFSVNELEDKVRRTYLYFIVFLSTALLLNVFIKIRVQHLSVVAHTLAVLGLAFILFLS